MKKFNRNDNVFSYYNQEQEKRRSEDIPALTQEKGKEPKSTDFFLDTEELTIGFQNVAEQKSIPPSIEYLSKKNKKLLALEESPKAAKKKESKISKSIKGGFLPELQASGTFEFKVDTTGEDRLQDLRKEPQLSKEELSLLDLAPEEKVKELFQLHMDFYSVLSSIQETNITSDFRSAYDIQDRISYVLDHSSLLSKDLVNSLISYLTDVVQRLKVYGEDLHRKRLKYSELNHRVSMLKEYKYKTDESFKLLADNRDMIEKETDKNA